MPGSLLAVVRIIFVTHATSLDNEQRLASGHYDVALSEVGEQQARELGLRYAGEPIAAVFCSDLQRSYRTAEIAFAGRKLAILRDARLRECDYGDLTRHPTAEIERLRLQCVEEPFSDGESYRQVAERTRDVLNDLFQQYNGRTILIVGHRATQYSLDHLLKGLPLAEAVTAPWTWQPGWEYEMPGVPVFPASWPGER